MFASTVELRGLTHCRGEYYPPFIFIKPVDAELIVYLS